MLGKHPSSKQALGKVLNCSHGLSSVIVVENSVGLGRRYGGAKSWLSPSSLKWSLGLQCLGAAVLVLHGAVTTWVKIVPGLY